MVTRADALLEVQSLRAFGTNPASFCLQREEIVVVQGPSGCGKTLLLRALCDLDPHEGEAFLDDVACHDMAPELWRAQVGYLPAESHWWSEQVGAHFSGQWQRWLAPLGLDPAVVDWQISRLSTGERQRLALIRALCRQPQVLLLDEPTANLDADNTRRVERLVLEYLREQRSAAVWVSHDLEQTRRVGNTVLRFGDGVWQRTKL